MDKTHTHAHTRSRLAVYLELMALINSGTTAIGENSTHNPKMISISGESFIHSFNPSIRPVGPTIHSFISLNFTTLEHTRQKETGEEEKKQIVRFRIFTMIRNVYFSIRVVYIRNTQINKSSSTNTAQAREITIYES